MSEFEAGAPKRQAVDAVRATARLPGLDIEIVHHRSPTGDTEQISINLQAVPSFEAFGRFVEAANPFAFWIEATRLAWFPWLEVARALTLPGTAGPLLPRVGSATVVSPSERRPLSQ